MALFTDREPDPEPLTRRPRWGWPVLAVALVGVTLVALVPAPYVIEQPGPVYNTLGTVTINGDDVSMIQVPSQKTYPTGGSLDMLTVSIRGNRDNLPNWLEVAAAYFDPSRAVVPVDSVYPVGQSVEQSNEQGRIDMANSQKEAIAAALTELGYDFPSTISVASLQDGGPADGVLQEGDIVESVNGETFADVSGLRAAVAANGTDTAASVGIVRDDVALTVEVTPALSEGDDPAPILGIVVGGDYDFPFDVDIQLDNVGGPSAGMMFALGIIDKLTPGELNGGAEVAGTGTITGTGEVGAIGGIRQKLYGARDAGAQYFLAPQSNCDEVTGHIPSGLQVFAVATLDDALAVLDTVSTDGDLSALPTCPAA